MSGVVKFSEASSIAMHTMAILAADPDRHMTIREVAAVLPISGNHLAKVLQRLAHAGLVESVRGPGGGFALRGDPEKITLLEVHEAIEGHFVVSPCLFSPDKCCGTCLLGDTPRQANALVHDRLSRTRLADVAPLIAPRPALVTLGDGAPEPPRATGRGRRRG